MLFSVLPIVYLALARVDLVLGTLTQGIIRATTSNGEIAKLTGVHNHDNGQIMFYNNPKDEERLIVNIDLDVAAKGGALVEATSDDWYDIYPYLGYVVEYEQDLDNQPTSTNDPGYRFSGKFCSVPKTQPGLPPVQGEDSFLATLGYYVPKQPWHASAIWKYDASNSNGNLLPSYIHQNGSVAETHIRCEAHHSDASHYQCSVADTGGEHEAFFNFVPLDAPTIQGDWF